MPWLEKWTSEEFFDMLTGKLNMVISPLCGSNGKFVGIPLLGWILLKFFTLVSLPGKEGEGLNKSHKKHALIGYRALFGRSHNTNY